MDRSVMTAEEVAKYLSFSVKHVYRLATHGQIPYSRIGGHLRFLKSRIDEWIRAHEVKPSVFCAGCNQVFTEPFPPPVKKREDLKSPEYLRVKQYMDGGEYFCAACFAKTKTCPQCGEHFLPDPQSLEKEVCFPCAALKAQREK